MKLAETQKAVRDCLAANAYFAGLEILLEMDPELATAAELAALDEKFEAALAGKGVALVVLSPFTSRLDIAKRGGLSLRVHVPLAIIENKEVNRAAGGFGKPALEVLEEAIATLLPQFEFADRPFGRPAFDNGLLVYYVQAETTHVIRARSA